MMVYVRDYIIEVKNGIARVRSESAVYCPDCGMKLFFHGTCKRKVRAQEQTRCYVLRVLSCKSCKRTHRELPDFIVGYKRYSRDELCEIVMNEESYSCEDSTRNRTIMWLYKLCNCTAQSLIEFLEKKMHRKRFVGFKDEINKEQCYALLLTLYRKVQVTNIHAADVGRVGGAWLKENSTQIRNILNGLAAGKDHQFKGRYDAEKNAVIISLEKDEQSALSPQKCTT